MSLKILSSDFAFYGVLDFFRKSVSIIMVPIYTRYLSQVDYGNLDIIIIVKSVLCVLVDLQFVAGFTRLYYDHRAVKKDKRFVGTTIVSRLISSIGIVAMFNTLGYIGVLEYEFLPSYQNNIPVWILSTVGVPLSLTFDILILQTRMLRWKTCFLVGSLTDCILSCAFSAIFVIALKWGIFAVILGLLLGKTISVMLLLVWLRKEIKICFDMAPFKELLKYSLPLVPGWWFAFGSTYLSRFYIFSELGAAQNAILAVCMKSVGIIGLFITSFQLAWQPLAMQYIGKQTGEIFYVRSMRLFIAGGIFSIYFVSAIIGPTLEFLTPKSYLVAQYYFPLFAVGSLLSGCANSLQLGNQISKNTYWISISSIICISVNFTILVIFTKNYGIKTAGIAWIISFAIKDVIIYLAAQKSHYIPYDKFAFVLLALGCFLLILLAFFNSRQYISSRIYVFSALTMGIAISWLVISPIERKIVIDILRSGRKSIQQLYK